MTQEKVKREVMASLAEALDMSPLEVETPGKAVVAAPEQDYPMTVNEREAEEDIQIARANLKSILEKGDEALDALLAVSKGTDHPKAYEALAKMIQALNESNRELIEMHRTRKEISTPSIVDTIRRGDAAAEGAPTKVTNVFVGTTAELLSLVKQARKEEAAETAPITIEGEVVKNGPPESEEE